MGATQISGQITSGAENGKLLKSFVTSEHRRLMAEGYDRILRDIAEERGLLVRHGGAALSELAALAQHNDELAAIIDARKKVMTKATYQEACANVGRMCKPPLDAEEVNRRSMAYVTAKGKQTRAAQKDVPVDSASGLGDDWYDVTEPTMSRAEEIRLYLGDLQPGRSRMKRGLESKDEAKKWQTAVAAFARTRPLKEGWYDRETKRPKFSTTTAELPEGDFAVVVRRTL